MKSTKWCFLHALDIIRAQSKVLALICLLVSSLSISALSHATYTGERNTFNRYHGYGVFVSSVGTRYEGQWVDGRKVGFGTMIWTSGDRYTGNWSDNRMNGSGWFTFANGDIYAGGFVGGRRHGLGEMTYANGDVYRGSWKSNRRHGKGQIIYANGGSYEGQWGKDGINGYGVFTLANGDKTSGTWREGVISGDARFYSNDLRYVGAVKGLKPHGQGICTRAGVDRACVFIDGVEKLRMIQKESATTATPVVIAVSSITEASAIVVPSSTIAVPATQRAAPERNKIELPVVGDNANTIDVIASNAEANNSGANDIEVNDVVINSVTPSNNPIVNTAAMVLASTSASQMSAKPSMERTAAEVSSELATISDTYKTLPNNVQIVRKIKEQENPIRSAVENSNLPTLRLSGSSAHRTTDVALRNTSDDEFYFRHNWDEVGEYLYPSKAYFERKARDKGVDQLRIVSENESYELLIKLNHYTGLGQYMLFGDEVIITNKQGEIFTASLDQPGRVTITHDANGLIEGSFELVAASKRSGEPRKIEAGRFKLNTK